MAGVLHAQRQVDHVAHIVVLHNMLCSLVHYALCYISLLPFVVNAYVDSFIRRLSISRDIDCVDTTQTNCQM